MRIQAPTFMSSERLPTSAVSTVFWFSTYSGASSFFASLPSVCRSARQRQLVSNDLAARTALCTLCALLSSQRSPAPCNSPGGKARLAPAAATLRPDLYCNQTLQRRPHRGAICRWAD